MVWEDLSEEALLRDDPPRPSQMGLVEPDGVSSTTRGGRGRRLDTSSSVMAGDSSRGF